MVAKNLSEDYHNLILDLNWSYIVLLSYQTALINSFTPTVVHITMSNAKRATLSQQTCS